jgi:hypothetical protein
MSRPRDACDRFLPSAASITSTRVSFVLDEVVASRPRKFVRFRVHHPPRFLRGASVRAPSGFTPPWCLWWMMRSLFFLPRVSPGRSSNHCRACRASSMCQLADPSAAAHTPKLRLERYATRSVKTSPFCDPARLPSKGTFLGLRLATFAARHREWTRCREPVRLSLVLPPTCRLTAPFHRCDTALRLQTRLPRLGPRAHPLVILMRMLL